MNNHTPTPWQISDARTTEDTPMIVGGEGFDFGLIADVTEDFDAAFIVKAANNHDDLVEAVGMACEYLESDDFRPAVRLREKLLALLELVGSPKP